MKYDYFVRYIEDGYLCSDSWTAETLARELADGVVEVIEVEKIGE